jgi:L-amino acid N-acyltransferase YncA
LSYWQAKLDRTLAGDHFLVLCENDKAAGYVCSGAFRNRPAYRLTHQTSVYLAPEATSSGLGTRLCRKLLNLFRQDDIHLVVAVVAQSHHANNARHGALGVPRWARWT